MPHTVYQQFSGGPENHLRGSSGLARAGVQVTTWGEDYTEARAQAEIVRTELNGYSGTAATVEVSSILLQNTTELGGEPDDGEEQAAVGVALDFVITYCED